MCWHRRSLQSHREIPWKHTAQTITFSSCSILISRSHTTHLKWSKDLLWPSITWFVCFFLSFHALCNFNNRLTSNSNTVGVVLLTQLPHLTQLAPAFLSSLAPFLLSFLDLVFPCVCVCVSVCVLCTNNQFLEVVYDYSLIRIQIDFLQLWQRPFSFNRLQPEIVISLFSLPWLPNGRYRYHSFTLNILYSTHA